MLRKAHGAQQVRQYALVLRACEHRATQRGAQRIRLAGAVYEMPVLW
jgi:hypothetical protein